MPGPPPPVRALAFHLPQFHPIPENDRWWGPGFTEWRNVTAAQPRFRGHQQPHLPADDVGFYDLRRPEVRTQQAEQAAAAGLSGFCYHHYWFGGRRLLEQPVDAILSSGQPDLGFLLCWANESWTRAWDGASGQVLIEQTYSPDDDLAHIRHLVESFADPRYVRIDGKPAFLVYRASRLPDPRRTTDTWRSEADRLGVGGLHLARVESGPAEVGDPTELGFDAAVEFQPAWARMNPLRLQQGRWWRLSRRLGLTPQAYATNRIFDYRDVAATMTAAPPPQYRRHPGVTPRWDNTARRATGATILRSARPEHYERWLTRAVEAARSDTDPVVFVNAWNEWAEGAHLEPDQQWGHAYIDATRRALAGGATVSPQPVPARRRIGDLAHRATRSVAYRVRRARRRSRRSRREITRPVWQTVEDRLPVPRRPGARSTTDTPRAVVACVARRRHADLLADLLAPARSAGWEIALWALEDDDDLGPRLPRDLVVGHGPGDRTDLLHHLVTELSPADDELVILVDDDIVFAAGDICELSRLVVDARFDLAMPAHARSSHSSHEITRGRPGAVARQTSFVEIGPVLVIGPAVREEVLNTLPGSGMGWGLEFEWARLTDCDRRLGIVDACRVRHVEPPASVYDRAEEQRRVERQAARHEKAGLADIQQTHQTWWRWQPGPPW